MSVVKLVLGLFGAIILAFFWSFAQAQSPKAQAPKAQAPKAQAPKAQPPESLRVHIPEFEAAQINVDGAQRSYLVHPYSNSRSAPRPIVILLHGYSGSAEQLMGVGGKTAPFRAWLDIAKRENLILIAPNGEKGSKGKQGWNDLRGNATNPTTDDLKFLQTLTTKAVALYGGDPDKVYIVGISNGGHMALRVAVEAPEMVRGVGVVAAGLPADLSPPQSAKPVSVVFMNGTRDRLYPYKGGEMKGERGAVVSTEDSVRYWAANNKCTDDPTVYTYPNIDRRDRSRVTRSSYHDCAGGTRVALFKVKNAGHNTPSIDHEYARRYQMLVGRQNRDIEAADEIWQVFTGD
jgi:polyhydroxybutyrate depolymerase